VNGPHSLHDQVAIVTGAGRGVGRAIAESLATAGAAVGLAARSHRELEAVADRLGRAGARALAVPTDVTDRLAVDRLVDAIVQAFGPPDLLVNAAGAWGEVGPVETADADKWWRDVEVNLRGTFLCTRAVLPLMTSRGVGRIVNVSSYAAIAPRPHATAYSASKAAVLRFSDSLAAELEGSGVRVFAVSPGFVRTRLVDDVAASEAGRRYLPELVTRTEALEPERAGYLVAQIAGGRLDPLGGRFLHVLDDVEDLLRRIKEIEEKDLYTLRMRT
jgi:NAD(P)-dependent dehydrogenase (short-subunit alcohol dehydrogenase family)